MKNFIKLSFTIIVLFGFNLQAQPIHFEQIGPVPLVGVHGQGENRTAFADIDGDNDQDVLLTGMSYSEIVAKLYTNDGNGNFTEVKDTPFEGVRDGSIGFADIDGDNDQDVLITGSPTHFNADLPIARLYTNDGLGNYTEVTGTPFVGVKEGSIAFTDVDGDNDQDVLIAGSTQSVYKITKLYINDGYGNFTEKIGTPFTAVARCTIDFSDIDGDNDQDVLITGSYSTKLYINDGVGNFTLVSGTPFVGVQSGSVAFSDIDGDNDPDVLITGETNPHPYQKIAKLYINDGVGNFTLVSGTPFEGIYWSSVAFSDIDGDNDQDVVITGRNNSRQKTTKLFSNDGLGSFTEVSETLLNPSNGIHLGSVVFSDIDGDNDQDVLISGQSDAGATSKLFVNDGHGNFTKPTGSPFDGVVQGALAFSDIDGDNDQDVLVTGLTLLNYPIIVLISKLYTNDGFGNYSEVTGTPFDEVFYSAIAFSDVDGDNDQDVLITGMTSSFGRIAKLYKNNGLGDFTEVLGTPFAGVVNSSIAFSDIDGDSDQDVLITGLDISGQSIAKLYSNDGVGNFAEVTGTPFTGIFQGAVVFSDIDGDNDQDVLIAGNTGEPDMNPTLVSKLYTNDGAGNFTEVTGTPFIGVNEGSAAFSDIDGDNDQDVIITGNTSGDMDDQIILISKLYTNDGAGNFTEVSGTPFKDVYRGSVAFADIDGDNDQDIFITGIFNAGESNDYYDLIFEKTSTLYTNDGLGNYTEATGIPFIEVSSRGSIAFADIDGDSDPDVMIIGQSNSGNVSLLYRNLTTSVCASEILTPDQSVLPTITAECKVDPISAPTATNNCEDQFTGTTETAFPITTQGTTVVTWTYDDGNGNTSTQTQNVIIDDITSPVADLATLADVSAECEVTSLTAPTATDNCLGVISVTNNATLPITGEGTTTVTWTYDDGNGNTATQTQNVIIDDNTAPVLSGIPAGSIEVENDLDLCGAEVDFPLFTATDNCSGDVAITTDYSSGSVFPVGLTTVTVTATDVCGNSISTIIDVIVTNEIPVIESITGPIDPVQIGSAIAPTASFTDSNLSNAVLEWGDGTDPGGQINGQTIAGTHEYQLPGVYTINLVLTDKCGETDTDMYQYVVVYDPDGGFVTGGGWIDSPLGAYTADPLLSGKANFGFVSKYKKGANVPTGNTEFQFKAGDLNFKSHLYDWLVIAGPQAKFKGEGQINGMGNYGFMLSAVDGQVNGGNDPDKFRIKIWEKSIGDDIVYDNQIGASDDAEPVISLGGGSITIHNGKDNNARVADGGYNIEELGDFSGISIYPNPVREIVTVEFAEDYIKDKESLEIHLFNLIGVDMINNNQRFVNLNKIEIDMKDLPAGIYLLMIPNGETTLKYKLSKL